MRPLLAVSCALLAALSFAGCVESPSPVVERPPVPQAWGIPPLELYTDATLLDLAFTASDGTVLRGTAYLPTDPRDDAAQNERFGTIVNLSPYYGNLYGIGTEGRLDAFRSGDRAFNETTTGMLVAHGFAYVAASVPGTGLSGGCFGLGGLHEQETMAEFIDWIGSQPWSNGNVGMIGGSYDGTTQWMAAIHAPKHLRTIVPQVSITDFYEYEYQDGAPYAWWGPLFLPHYLLLVGWGIEPFEDPPRAGIQPDLLLEDLCPEALDHFTEAEKAYATGVYSDWWLERNYKAHFADLNASVLLVQGFQDWNVKPLHLDVWGDIPTEKVFWLQQMQHNAPWRNSYNPDWSRPDYNATILAWYDHYLNEVENGVPDLLPAAWTQDQTGHWRTETQWPPASVQESVLHLGAGSLAAARPPNGQTMFATPPSHSRLLIEPKIGLRGPTAPEQFVAKFQTEPLAEPLRISGVPRLELNVSVDRPGYSHLVAQLYALHDDGTWEWLDMGGRGLAQRDGRERDDDVPPMQVLQVPIRLNPVEAYLPAGARLVLTLTGDDPDWFHPNGHAPIYFLEHGSTLHLPLLPTAAPRGFTPEEVADHNPFYRADNKQF